MNNPGIQEEIWISLRQKWSSLTANGHTVKVEFGFIQDPKDKSKTIAIDVAQNIDGEWYVQTVQSKLQEAYPLVGIMGLTLDQLIDLADRVVNTVTKPITGWGTYDDEMHLFMKRISLLTSEIHGHVVSKQGEKINVRTNYLHYYVINEILEQISNMVKEEYAEIQLHRNKDDHGRIYFRFVHS